MNKGNDKLFKKEKNIPDESIHGVFIGLLVQKIFNTFSLKKQEKLKTDLLVLMDLVYENEFHQLGKMNAAG